MMMLGTKNLPNLLETDEPPTSSSTAVECCSSSVRRPLTAMNDLSIGGRHLVSEVQMWWANCLHDDDQWAVRLIPYSWRTFAYLCQSHLVSEVQMWWANCLHDDDQWTVSLIPYSWSTFAYLRQQSTSNNDDNQWATGVLQLSSIFMKDICIFMSTKYQ